MKQEGISISQFDFQNTIFNLLAVYLHSAFGS